MIQDGIELGKAIISEVNKKVKKSYWTNEKIERLFGRRSAKEILRDGDTCFMNPCLDVTLVSATILNSKGIDYKMSIEEYLPNEEYNFNRLHFALEYKYEDKNFFINYKTLNEVQISKGNYSGRKDLKLDQIFYIPGEDLDPEKTVYQSLGFDSLEALLKNKLNNYSLKSNIDRLKKDNSEELFNKFVNIYGENFKIIELKTPQQKEMPLRI